MTSGARGTGQRATNADLDHAIDLVARQMTEGSRAGGPDFRRRVLARIEAGHAPRGNRRGDWRAAWVLSPLAAAAAIVMAIFVARGFQPRDHGPERGAPLETSTVAQSAAPQRQTVSPNPVPVRLKPPLDAARGGPQPVEGPDAAVGAGAARAVTVGAGTVRAGTNRAVSNLAAAALSLQLDALAAPSIDLARLTVTTLAPDPIQFERLDMAVPIAISPLEVAPLDITDLQRR